MTKGRDRLMALDEGIKRGKMLGAGAWLVFGGIENRASRGRRWQSSKVLRDPLVEYDPCVKSGDGCVVSSDIFN